MFGAIKPYYKSLSKEEKKTYMNYYCGLCKALGDNFGNLSKITLSNDMTFFYILLDSMNSRQNEIDDCRCICKFGCKRSCIYNNDIVNYIAKVNFFLAYEKMLDNVIDDNSFVSKILLRVFEKKYNNIMKSTEVIVRMKQLLKDYYLLEENGGDIFDLADAFSLVTKEICSEWQYDECDMQILQEICSLIGKWIYVMDAWKDFEDDIKKERFNPLMKNLHGTILTSNDMDEVKQYLYKCQLHIQEYIVCLGINKNKKIIRNIIYDNFDMQMGMMLRKEEKNDKK